jgi:hypothetical protein
MVVALDGRKRRLCTIGDAGRGDWNNGNVGCYYTFWLVLTHARE